METTKLPPPLAKKHRAPSATPDVYEPDLTPADDGGHNGHDDDLANLEVRPPRPLGVVVVAVLVVGLLAALLLVGLLPRQTVNKELAANADAALNAPVPVSVVHATQAPSDIQISLPGNLRPWQEVSIFARTTGYLKGFYVDISNQVKAGQLLAQIETPEVEHQLKQAEAAVLQAKAAVLKAQSDLGLAQVTFNRYNQLSHTGSVTQQDLDSTHATVVADQANVEAAKANVAAAEANVQRLTQMVAFEKITAPFAGVVTGRAYDVGALINADPTTVDIKPMFKLAENDVLRVFVNVPQSSALQIRKGMQVKVTARELPGREFTGSVMGTTNYLDPTNRSLLTEVKVNNEKGPDGELALLPGMYVSVSFELHRDRPPLIIPAPALVSNAEGTQVAVIRDGKAHFLKVTLGEDSGNEVEILTGLSKDDEIIATPGERTIEGAPVKVVANADEPKKG